MKGFDSVKNGNNDQFKKESKKMNTAPQELLKEYVQSQHFTSTAEIMSAMKEMFRDVIQMVLGMQKWKPASNARYIPGAHLLVANRPQTPVNPGAVAPRFLSRLRCLLLPAEREKFITTP